MTVSVLLLRTMSTSGIRHKLMAGSRHPRSMAPFCDGDYGVVGVVYVDSVLVKYGDVIGIGVFSRAEERVLTDAGGEVEFVGWCSDVERILRFFCCLDHLSAGKDEPFVRWFACAMAWVVLGSDSRCSFHFSASLFRLRVFVAGVKLHMSLNVTRRSVSCSSTWHAGGDRQV